ncbi:hypothetical protein [Terrisporobacter mayombei]|uniref:Uncharacterized protein n=1 Tax=Terrisporobacter mayombei TaxID=1541 RepID=A0ABY9Q7Z0_9FIRM|nr:hypothetical protein [Terrisporobacter mayombei]MCC3869769.1 hypothetical protein [Terrisporobacter mayombei]WMT83291.1 hypothetical protein TEMA_38020 [Terrisporobacter mayombei]
MENKRKTKRIAIALACILIPLGALGFGYFVGGDKATDKEVANTLTVDGKIEGTVVNTQDANTDGIVPGDTISKTINIKPNSTAPSLLRVKIEPSWYNGNNKTELPVSNIKFIYTNNIVKDDFTTSGKDYWYKCDDGYLYYMNSVTTTEAMELVEGIKFLGGSDDTDAKEYQGKNLKITVTMDMIQCKYAPYKTRWEVPSSSELYTKLKALCPESDKYVEE